jgi:hypothetical protein
MINAIQPSTSDPFAPEKIAKLLKELGALEIKHKLKGSLNVFEAAGLGRQETKSSKMLAFLLTPSNPHGLGAEVLKALIVPYFNDMLHPANGPQIRPTQFLLDSLSDVTVVCEWKRIDVLIYCDRLRFVVAIENKIDAREMERSGVSQLERYAATLENDARFKGFSKLHLFLTVDGEEPTDSRWTPITHNEILSCLRTHYDEAQRYGVMTPEAQFFINNYIDFLERNIVTNPILEEDCRQIYQRHKTILDKIASIATSGVGISQYAEEFVAKVDAIIVTNNPTRMAYLPNDLMLLPDNTMEKPWWGQSKPIMMWFEIDGKDRLKLTFQVGPMKDPDMRLKFVEALFSIFGGKQKRLISEKYTSIVSMYEQTDQDSDLMELMLQLHRRLAEHMPKLKELIQTFNFSPAETAVVGS